MEQMSQYSAYVYFILWKIMILQHINKKKNGQEMICMDLINLRFGE